MMIYWPGLPLQRSWPAFELPASHPWIGQARSSVYQVKGITYIPLTIPIITPASCQAAAFRPPTIVRAGSAVGYCGILRH